MKDMNDVAEFVLALTISLLAMACTVLIVDTIIRPGRYCKEKPAEVRYEHADQ
jgi:hypothetical protein